MSFSSDLKTELSKLNNLKNKQEVLAEFLGYMGTGNINIEGKRVKFSTENEYNINRFAKLLNNLNITNYKIELTGGKTFVITFNEKEINALESKIETENLKKAYIRGNFLGAGSINNPESKYHLEVIYVSNEKAKYSQNILKEYNITAKVLEKENPSLYIKDGEEISKFLAFIGANKAVIQFEEIRVLRETKNNVNRLVNCETANMNKVINTSVKQISDIKKLKKTGKFNSLPEDLKEIAVLREENPEATLEELGGMLKKPISKSSVSHRFKKIEEYL